MSGYHSQRNHEENERRLGVSYPSSHSNSVDTGMANVRWPATANFPRTGVPGNLQVAHGSPMNRRPLHVLQQHEEMSYASSRTGGFYAEPEKIAYAFPSERTPAKPDPRHQMMFQPRATQQYPPGYGRMFEGPYSVGSVAGSTGRPALNSQSPVSPFQVRSLFQAQRSSSAVAPPPRPPPLPSPQVAAPPSPARQSQIRNPPMSPAPPSRTASASSQRGDMMESVHSDVPTRAPPVVDKGLKLLTGTVDQVVRWAGDLSDEVRPNLLFEIVGTLDGVRLSPWPFSHIIVVQALQGSAQLKGIFWEIDRALQPVAVGSFVSCTGCVTPRRYSEGMRRIPRLQILKLRVLRRDELPHLTRIAFASQRLVQQGALKAPAPPPASPAPPPASPARPAPGTPMKQTLISSYATPRRQPDQHHGSVG